MVWLDLVGRRTTVLPRKAGSWEYDTYLSKLKADYADIGVAKVWEYEYTTGIDTLTVRASPEKCTSSAPTERDIYAPESQSVYDIPEAFDMTSKDVTEQLPIVETNSDDSKGAIEEEFKVTQNEKVLLLICDLIDLALICGT